MNKELFLKLYKNNVHPDCLEFVESLGNPDRLEKFYETKLYFLRKLVTEVYFEIGYEIKNTSISYMDLYQEACLSFFEQMKRFNPYCGIGVISFTYLGCKFSVINYLNKMLHTIDLSYRQYKKLREEFTEDETTNISSFSNYIIKKVYSDSVDYENNTPQQIEMLCSIQEVFNHLSQIEKMILLRKVGIYSPKMSIADISKELSLKQCEVYSIYNKTLNKIRKLLCV